MTGADQSNREAWAEGTGVYRGRRAGYARVHVRRCDNDLAFSVSVELDEHVCNDQLRTGDFKDWIAAAIFGCRYACEVADVKSGRLEIRRIVGLLVDTTVQFVVIAAARAVWNVCSHPASELENERLMEVANTFQYEPLENPE